MITQHRISNFGFEGQKKLPCDLESASGLEHEVGASGGIDWNCFQVVGEEVGGGGGRFAVVELIGVSGEGEEELAARELVGLDFLFEVSPDFLGLAECKESGKPGSPSVRLTNPMSFLPQVFFCGRFFGIDGLKAFDDLAGVWGIERVGKRLEMALAERFDADACHFEDHDRILARFLGEIYYVEVDRGGIVGAVLEFGESAFGCECEAELFKGREGNHCLLRVSGGEFQRDSALVGKPLTKDGQGRCGITRESGKSFDVQRFVGGVVCRREESRGFLKYVESIGSREWLGLFVGRTQEYEGGQDEIAEHNNGEQAFDGLLGGHLSRRLTKTALASTISPFHGNRIGVEGTTSVNKKI